MKKVNSSGILEEYTLKEVQDLVDKLGTEKDKNGNIKDQFGFNNASYVLMHMYNDTKYDEEKNNFIKELNDRLRTNKEEVGRVLEETAKDVAETTTTSDIAKSKRIQQVGGDGLYKELEVNNKPTTAENTNLKEFDDAEVRDEKEH